MLWRLLGSLLDQRLLRCVLIIILGAVLLIIPDTADWIGIKLPDTIKYIFYISGGLLLLVNVVVILLNLDIKRRR